MCLVFNPTSYGLLTSVASACLAG